jgi:hypothetical protein
MNQALDFSWLRTAARWLLDEQDWLRVVDPTLADAQFEKPAWKDERHWRWYTRYRLVTTIAAALCSTAVERWRGTPRSAGWALLFAGICGYEQMRAGFVRGATNHALFVALGAVIACGIVVVPGRLLRAGAWGFGLAVVAAMLACPFHGTTFEGHRQWLACFGLSIHVASLFLPVFALVVAACWRSRSFLLFGATAVASLALLALQPDWQSFVVYVCVLLSVALSGLTRSMRWAFAACVAASLLPLLGKAAERGPWTWLGVLGLSVAQLSVIFVGATRRRPWTVRQIALLTTLVATTTMRSWTHDLLPVVDFGGSITVVFFVVSAACMRYARYPLNGGNWSRP